MLNKNTEFLSPIEIGLIQSFADNDAMCEAVKKLLLAGVYENGTLKPGENANFSRNFALSLVFSNPDATNEQLGQDLRAAAEGGRMVENAFKEISNYKTKPERSETKNPAR